MRNIIVRRKAWRKSVHDLVTLEPLVKSLTESFTVPPAAALTNSVSASTISLGRTSLTGPWPTQSSTPSPPQAPPQYPSLTNSPPSGSMPLSQRPPNLASRNKANKQAATSPPMLTSHTCPSSPYILKPKMTF